MSKPRAVQFSATLAGANRRADKSVTVRLATELEATVDFMTWLDAHYGDRLEVLLSEDLDAPAEFIPPKDGDGKTASQRLRNRLFGEYGDLQKTGTELPEFPEYYEGRMNQIIADTRYGN